MYKLQSCTADHVNGFVADVTYEGTPIYPPEENYYTKRNAPAYYAPAAYKQEPLPPQPYAYEYPVADDYSKANFKKHETQDASGRVKGSFTIALPDGRIQTTSYTADHVDGFVADVTYEGEPVYPPEPINGYGHPAPAYKPASAYKPYA